MMMAPMTGSSVAAMLCCGGSWLGLWTSIVSPSSWSRGRTRRGGRDQVQVELALEALLDDLHVEEAEETAPEAEPSAPELSGS